jgi:hypothetical protein
MPAAQCTVWLPRSTGSARWSGSIFLMQCSILLRVGQLHPICYSTTAVNGEASSFLHCVLRAALGTPTLSRLCSSKHVFHIPRCSLFRIWRLFLRCVLCVQDLCGKCARPPRAACVTFIHTPQHLEFKDCLRDWLNERDFVQEAFYATGARLRLDRAPLQRLTFRCSVCAVIEHACAALATVMCAAGGHWVSAFFGCCLCMLHLDE